MSSGTEDVALRALLSGVGPTTRDDFQPGEARALAIDILGDDAAVFVVRLQRDGYWITDIVRFVAVDGAWTDNGSGGGTYGDLPFELDMTAPPEIALLTSGTCGSDDRALAYAGGFLIGPVDEVELVTSLAARRVPLGINRQAFVILAPAAIEQTRTRHRFRRPNGPDVRAYAGGVLVDDSAEWHRERDEALAGVLTVEQALAAPSDTTVTVRGVLLQLENEPAMLCDDVDVDVTPPRPFGPAIQLPGPAGAPSWTPDSAGLSLLKTVATGVIRDGVLHSPEERPD